MNVKEDVDNNNSGDVIIFSVYISLLNDSSTNYQEPTKRVDKAELNFATYKYETMHNNYLWSCLMIRIH
jgi:hypothetical protein